MPMIVTTTLIEVIMYDKIGIYSRVCVVGYELKFTSIVVFSSESNQTYVFFGIQRNIFFHILLNRVMKTLALTVFIAGIVNVSTNWF